MFLITANIYERYHDLLHINSSDFYIGSHMQFQLNSILFQHKTEKFTKKLVSHCNIFTITV